MGKRVNTNVERKKSKCGFLGFGFSTVSNWWGLKMSAKIRLDPRVSAQRDLVEIWIVRWVRTRPQTEHVTDESSS
jgi:hypothetical protein